MIAVLQRILFCFLLIGCLWTIGLAWFVRQIPQTPLANNVTADAIVVLTGGSLRLEYGLALLAQGRAKQLFISGVSKDVARSDLLQKASPEIRGKLQHLKPDAITLGREAENTIGNAEETVHWLRNRQYRRILLVTSNYHIPRSVTEFKELAGKAVTIIPAPVFPEGFTPWNWWRAKDTRVLLLSEYHKLMASKLRHALLPSLQEDV